MNEQRSPEESYGVSSKWLTLVMKPSSVSEAPDWGLFDSWEQGRDHLIVEIEALHHVDEFQRDLAVQKLQSAPPGSNRSVHVGNFMFGLRKDDDE